MFRCARFGNRGEAGQTLLGFLCRNLPGNTLMMMLTMMMMMLIIMLILMMMMMMGMMNTLALQRIVTVWLKPFQAASCKAVFPCWRIDD